MKLNYSNLFDKKNFGLQTIPLTTLQYLNSTIINDDFVYTDIQNGTCILTPKNHQTIKISNLRVDLSEKQKKILGRHPTLEEVLKYSYDFQENIQTQPSDSVCINDKTIPVNEFIYFPFSNSKVENGKFIIIPDSFEAIPPFTLIVENVEMEIQMKRIPNSDKNIQKYVGENKEKTLTMTVTYNTEDDSNSLNITYNLSNAKCYADFLSCAKIYNGIIDGKTLIKDINKPFAKDGSANLKINKFNIKTWEKIIEIERKLNCIFSPSLTIDYDEILTIEKLYKNLIENKPYKTGDKINTLTFTTNPTEIERNLNKPLFFQFNSSAFVNLLGIKLELYAITCIYHMMIYKVEEDEVNNNYIARFKESNSGVKPYISSMLFASEDKMNEFVSKNNVAEIFSRAEPITIE